VSDPLQRHPLDWQEVATVRLRTIGRDRVDLVGGIAADDHPVAAPSARIAPDDDDSAAKNGPLALDPHEPAADVEDQVVSLAVRERLVDADPELDRRVDDR